MCHGLVKGQSRETSINCRQLEHNWDIYECVCACVCVGGRGERKEEEKESKGRGM